MGTAPAAIWKLWYDIEAKWRGPGTQDELLSGIVGDRLHSFGYHLSPNDLRSLGEYNSDYSLQTNRDKLGAKFNPDLASALDVHFGPSGMITATRRLIASAKDPDDPRLNCLYEFCGTTNGHSPHPFTVDTGTDDPANTQGWDLSHVTHVHLSFHRDVCDNYDAIKAVADVIAGIPLRKEFTVDAEAKAAFAALTAELDAIKSRFVGSDGNSHTVEATVAHVTQGAGYLSKKGTLWQRLFRRSDIADAAVKK